MQTTPKNPQSEPIHTSFFDNVKGVVETFAKPKNKTTKVDKKTKVKPNLKQHFKEKNNEPKPTPHRQNIDNSPKVQNDIREILQNDYQGISPYSVAMLLLVLAILWTGTQVVQQVQDYHEAYSKLLVLKKSFRHMQVERQRMLIEQQTFSATPQVTNRAVSELNMFYPNVSDRMIINNNGTIIRNNVASATVETIVIDPRTQH